MKITFTSLNARLSFVLLLLFVVICVGYLVLVNWSTNRYYQEVTQNLNKSLGMYIAGRSPLIVDGAVNRKAMNELADLVMVVNPIVEVYLLDRDGQIISHAVEESEVNHKIVDVAPIDAWLNTNNPAAVFGTNPRSGKRDVVFSAWPVDDNGQKAGYLYVVLGGEKYQKMRDSLGDSYVYRLSAAGLLAISLFALITAIIFFSFMTKPLRRLAHDMQKFQREILQDDIDKGSQSGNEIWVIQQSFSQMQQRIIEQIEALSKTDNLRRELVSNVSHDLRTPLASMQGYLETLLVRKNTLSEQDREKYLKVAFSHSKRLTRLVQDLFELGKLDAGKTEIVKEDFSLTELLQDIIQKYELKAEKKQISLRAQLPNQANVVNADIGLIERVLENLIDNALNYTPSGGRVDIAIGDSPDGVKVEVADNGVGMPSCDIPKIFDRYFRSRHTLMGSEKGTGLGLAIVKRILDLHQCRISVVSTEGEGASFSFNLPEAKRAG
ncbi:HAMP domain-containing histidine kinase [Gilvimarinus agarilyticus]|uniref:sensor histidine kinase n=1 Tax=Gilvimarinus sp. 2_MG-2023 TaxID=3062666 RepID=UPI001C09DD8F|nr:HAMP domain-containing sensor histidine kinase [Gilvimarinus sp. 2_MG-2023]MBU2885459.1 HAMP domain-containing histidine kinase [Gilvimarinus agarilyticus]MDO6570359.1 HAMP domain-containing sensor histidine kinase [Gilvimarinus sp. 2_MG-2023]